MRQIPSLCDITVKYIADKLSIIAGSNNELYIKILQYLRNQGLLSAPNLKTFLIPKIHSINFTSCVQINDECLQIIAKICPSIQNLVLAKCPTITDQGIQVIGYSCAGIKLLHISKCFQITDKAFTEPYVSYFLKILTVVDNLVANGNEGVHLKPFSSLLELDVSGTKITDETVVYLATNCQELKLLDVSDCNITIRSIEKIEEHLPSLKLLRISGCHMEYGSSLSKLHSLEALVARQCPLIGDNTIVDLINASTALVSLDLQWSGITDDTVKELTKISSRLLSLRLSWCSLIGEAALSNLLKQCVNLQTLDVSWRSLHDDTLQAITENCTKLKLMDISGCNELSDKSLANCGGEYLEFLSLSWCRGLSDDAFKKIISRSPNLKTIDLSLCSNVSPLALPELAKCTKLQALMILKCPQFADAQFTEVFKHLPDLTILNLSESHITDNTLIELAHASSKLRILVLAGCKAITSKGIVELAKNCSNLESLNVSNTSIDDEGVSKIVSSCGGIVSIWLNGCKCITEESVMAVAQHTRVLQQVYLSYCPNIKEEALLQLARSCLYLQVVEISNCAAVTDRFVCDLITHSTLLQVLNVSGCQSLTDGAIDYLWLYGQHLTSLDVSRCPTITSPAISSFSALMPQVNVRKNGL